MIEVTQKKLREAKLFLRMLSATGQQGVRNEPEEFDFYVSAFLSGRHSL